MVVDGDTESLGNAVGGDVVVGRTDAPGGEDVGVTAAQRIHGLDDGRFIVGDDADFLQVDADAGQVAGQIADVLVFGASGENFVADDDHGGRDDFARFRLARGVHCWAET